MVISHIPLKLILVEDPKVGGYTSFFAQFPEILAQGETEDEATENLFKTVSIVFKHKGGIGHGVKKSEYNVIEKDINLDTCECRK